MVSPKDGWDHILNYELSPWRIRFAWVENRLELIIDDFLLIICWVSSAFLRVLGVLGGYEAVSRISRFFVTFVCFVVLHFLIPDRVRNDNKGETRVG